MDTLLDYRAVPLFGVHEFNPVTDPAHSIHDRNPVRICLNGLIRLIGPYGFNSFNTK